MGAAMLCLRHEHREHDAAFPTPRGEHGRRQIGRRPASATALVANTRSRGSPGACPAFVLAQAFAAHGVRVAPFVRKGSPAVPSPGSSSWLLPLMSSTQPAPQPRFCCSLATGANSGPSLTTASTGTRNDRGPEQAQGPRRGGTTWMRASAAGYSGFGSVVSSTAMSRCVVTSASCSLVAPIPAAI